MPRTKIDAEPFKVAFVREVARVLDAVGAMPSFRDNFFCISREGVVTWYDDAASGQVLQRAMDEVDFSAIGRECGVFATWGILAAFDGPGDYDMGGGTMVIFDSHGFLKEVVMCMEDKALFRRYT